MSTIWFTADTHYDHANIIRFSKRPQLQEGDEVEQTYFDRETGKEGTRMYWASPEIAAARVKQMNEEMLEAHNALVRPGDTVYHLGDFCMNRDRKAVVTKRVEWWVKQLNGHYHWIFGNHDHSDARKAEGFASKQHYKELRIGGKNREMFCLFHYAMRTWNSRHHGAIQLYGHSHGSLPNNEFDLAWDVGVDPNEMLPVHIDAIRNLAHVTKALAEVKGVNWKGEDHHSSKRVD